MSTCSVSCSVITFDDKLSGLRHLSDSLCHYSAVSVVVLFFVSWAPFHIQRLGYVYFKHFEMFRTVNQILFYFSGCFYYLSSTLNPLLYNVMSVKYRQVATIGNVLYLK